jgi:hypothetical protein
MRNVKRSFLENEHWLSTTQHTLCKLFIVWQVVSTLSIGHHQANCITMLTETKYREIGDQHLISLKIH